jgi:phospholipase C
MREFRGDSAQNVSVVVDHAAGHPGSGALEVRVANHDPLSYDVVCRDESYGQPARHFLLRKGDRSLSFTVPVTASHGWYDFSVTAGHTTYRYAGRVETGAWSVTDPAMG